MYRTYTVIIFFFTLLTTIAESATWERLYSMRSTDCFRHVCETSGGDFVIAGYTADFNSNDTDGIVMRMNDDGDTIWTFTYNGPNDKEDCFYKVYQTSDGGFIVCGYSRSFNGSDNALVIKLSSSGSQQWVKNWGGSGIERAQDIVELNNGDFVAVGYSTSSPAKYYDAFIWKLNDNGSTIWTKLYGWNSYDDANSVKLLSDGGFILGGQSNSDLFLIRTDSDGDSLWTRVFGTSGTDNIESIALAHGGGFIMCGHTNGTGSNGNNGYIVKTDVSGNVLWSETYGGNDQDDLHYIDLTSDGGYIATGTSGGGTWPDPNIWLVKIDNVGVRQWQKYFGGDEHDHGYAGIQTADGGYVVVGHTESYADLNYDEDAIVVKTNSSGNVSNELNYTTVTKLISPVSGECTSSNVEIKVEIANYSGETVSSIPVTIEITGATTQTLTQTYSSDVDRDETKTLTFSASLDMSASGSYHFHCYTGNPHDVIPERNYLNKTIVVNPTTSSPAVNGDLHCGPGTVTLSATSSSTVKWYNASSGGSSIHTGSSFTTPYLSSSKTYYVQAGSTCPSARVPVTATIITGIDPPAVTDESRCGNGSIHFTASSPHNINWYLSPTSSTILHSGSSFNTPSLPNSTTYYVEADSGICSSPRISVNAVINPIPDDPLVTDVSRCGVGSVQLSAVASDSVHWYDTNAGGSLLATGSIFTTPSLNQTTSFYAEAFDGTCLSNRVEADAEIFSEPVVDLGADTIVSVYSFVELDPGNGFSNYLWSNSHSGQILTVNSDGYYCVTVTDANGCTGTDCALVQFAVGINQNQLSSSMSLFATAGFIRVINPERQIVTFELYAVDGRLMESREISDDNSKIDCSHLPDGLYIALLKNKTHSLKKRLVLN